MLLAENKHLYDIIVIIVQGCKTDKLNSFMLLKVKTESVCHLNLL